VVSRDRSRCGRRQGLLDPEGWRQCWARAYFPCRH
jgi:hypothetical protein